ncbi:50S ribosomal protein L10 [Candidatus Berkelbacteria bacterium]|nr:50S ribosomal protein L10 [Candidatus Berkelbacteria bacterium]
MAKTRAQKEAQLAHLVSDVAGKATVFTRYAGLTVRDMETLRADLRRVGGTYRVSKTTLLAKALEQAGITDVPAEILSVQLAIATSPTDGVEAGKIVVGFAKTNESIQILGALIDGTFVGEAGVRALAALPSRAELYARLVGSLNAPLSGLVNVLAGNLRGLVTVLKQYQAKVASSQ